MDSGFRRNDKELTFYEFIKIGNWNKRCVLRVTGLRRAEGATAPQAGCAFSVALFKKSI
jgi:hypothetical protein